MVNGGQASIAISNTSPNLFTVPGDRIIAVNSLDGALTKMSRPPPAVWWWPPSTKSPLRSFWKQNVV
ncbi:conjugal transfer protein TraK [Klebsiella pneumoniae subsp. ozaenae]|uniref:Conjugal transfer protein TraK n=1 Tax=Klebsiella pneumoniae subsp. ozaenae TaxID=574 RepID=A0A378UCK0_KLEPO|nr:conjugal transfer protein TraK [Klebsiella pneumoniae subsp. ozaenae]